MLELQKAKGNYSLAVFLDIKGAFDTISPEHIRTSLLSYNIDKDIVKWYNNYITHRNIAVSYTHLTLPTTPYV